MNTQSSLNTIHKPSLIFTIVVTVFPAVCFIPVFPLLFLHIYGVSFQNTNALEGYIFRALFASLPIYIIVLWIIVLAKKSIGYLWLVYFLLVGGIVFMEEAPDISNRLRNPGEYQVVKSYADIKLKTVQNPAGGFEVGFPEGWRQGCYKDQCSAQTIVDPFIHISVKFYRQYGNVTDNISLLEYLKVNSHKEYQLETAAGGIIMYLPDGVGKGDDGADYYRYYGGGITNRVSVSTARNSIAAKQLLLDIVATIKVDEEKLKSIIK